MRMSGFKKLYEKMTEGRVYRREELLSFSSAVDRDLNELLKEDLLKKVAPGMYCKLKKSKWGKVPADESD